MTKKPQNSSLSRRDFLRISGLVAAGLLTSRCQSQQPTPIASIPPNSPKPSVAIGKVQTYDRTAIESQVQTLIDQLGGLGSVVKPGDSVAIKTNLTGGVSSGLLNGIPAEESYVTHPEVVRALVKQVKAAGAGEIFIVEAVYELASYIDWGYEDIASDLGVTLIDLNNSKPYTHFVETPVGPDSHVYDKFIFKKYFRDYSWEKKCIEILGELGIFSDDDISFYPISSEGKHKEQLYNLLETVNNSYHDLIDSGFLLTSRLNQNFNLRPVSIEMSSHIENDWFDLRAIVKIGDWEIPFTSFRAGRD